MNRIKAGLMLALAVSMLALGVPVKVQADSVSWFNYAWDYRVMVTVHSDKVDSDLTDFTVFVDLEDMPDHFFENVNSDGSDIVVTREDAVTSVPRELVRLDLTNKDGEIWFKVPVLYDLTDLDFYIYYGNDAATQSNSTSTWSNGFQNVQHMEENPSSTTTASDSSPSSANGTYNGSMSSSDIINGQIDYGLDYDGSDDAINLGNRFNYGTSPFTLSIWFQTSASGFQFLIGNENPDNDSGYGIRQAASGSGIILCGLRDNAYHSGFTDYGTNGGFNDGNWHYAVCTRSGNSVKTYVDGFLYRDMTDTSSVTNSYNFWMGRRNTTPYDKGFWDGGLDEGRVATIARSADWITTEYNNQGDPDSFYTITGPQTQNPGTDIGMSVGAMSAGGTDEIDFDFGPLGEYESGDTITYTFGVGFSVDNCTPATTDADGDSTTDGAGVGSSNTYTYTFTASTTQAFSNGVDICIEVTAPTTSGNYPIYLEDSGGSHSGGLIYVGNENQVNITADVDTVFTLAIRNSDDNADLGNVDSLSVGPNLCDLGGLNDSGVQTCSYRIKVTSNAVGGYTVNIATDGALRNSDNSEFIDNVTEDTTVVSGTEGYGIALDAGSATDGTMTEEGDFSDDDTPTSTAVTTGIDTAFFSCDSVNNPSGNDTTNTALITHRAEADSGTPAGTYTQLVTYTVSGSF